MKLKTIADFYGADRVRIYKGCLADENKIADFPLGYMSLKNEIFSRIDIAEYGNKEVSFMGLKIGTLNNDKEVVLEILL